MDKDTKVKCPVRQRQILKCCSCQPGNTKDKSPPPEARKRQEMILPGVLEGPCPCWQPWFQASSLQNYGTISFWGFLNYILLFMLLQLSQFPLFAPLHSATPLPSGNPHTIVFIDRSCIQGLSRRYPAMKYEK